MPSNPPRVALVGHCGFDSGSLTRLVRSTFPEAEVAAVNHDQQLAPPTGGQAGFDLLLVNRVLDGRFDAADGIDLIRTVSAHTPSLLISNFPEAQADAEAAGAQPGFGKSDLSSPIAAERLRDALTPTT
ncbi:MAG: hypothetical protein AAGI68_11655 [Planctomycetota bacterium]